MARSRQTKTIAKRIDLGYFKRPHALRTWRRALTWICGGIALIWLGTASVRMRDGKLAMSDQIYNPAPVTEAHAMFQNDCVQCHTPKSGGGFVLSVTDAACLVCHDGSLHHPNQKQADTAALVSRETKTLAMKDANHAGGALSAACATCHLEHKGNAMLAATSDAHCIVCHSDLKVASINSSPKVQASVVAFDLASHPPFGRRLRNESAKWVDPTILKFNHKVHQENAKAFKEVANNCVICHQADPSDRRYMLPVTYEQHCQKCHALAPTNEAAPLTHGDMSIARAQLASPSLLYERALAQMPEEDRKKALAPRPTRPGRPATGPPMAPEKWASDKVASLKSAAMDWMNEDGARKLPGYEVIKAATTQPDMTDRQTLQLMEAYAAFGMTSSCSKCHQVEQSPNLQAFVTAPTGMGHAPRRWFTASIFNHDSHRDQSCRECHEAAWTSENTSDLLLPDINTLSMKEQSCVTCHHPDTSSAQRGAPASCYVCHNFHDRSLERPLLTMNK